MCFSLTVDLPSCPVNEVGDEGAQALAAVLSQTKLTQLGLRGSFVFLPASSERANADQFSFCLAEPAIKLRDGGAFALAAVLSQTKLTHLDLSCTFCKRFAERGCLADNFNVHARLSTTSQQARTRGRSCD